MESLTFREEELIWGVLTEASPSMRPTAAGRFAPFTNRQWRVVFRQWALEYAYCFSQGPPSEPHTPIVNHRPVRSEDDCLEVVLSIIDVIHTGGPVDLSDPLIFSVWLDFLNDHEVRAAHWTSWMKGRGELRFL